MWRIYKLRYLIVKELIRYIRKKKELYRKMYK